MSGGWRTCGDTTTPSPWLSAISKWLVFVTPLVAGRNGTRSKKLQNPRWGIEEHYQQPLQNSRLTRSHSLYWTTAYPYISGFRVSKRRSTNSDLAVSQKKLRKSAIRPSYTNRLQTLFLRACICNSTETNVCNYLLPGCSRSSGCASEALSRRFLIYFLQISFIPRTPFFGRFRCNLDDAKWCNLGGDNLEMGVFIVTL